jgi:MFS transporter, PAT family, beta-lactamase induction signal transducer AmpG
MPGMSAASPQPARSRWWVHTTYFAEGMPYMVVRILSAVYFTDIGAKLRDIGYLNFLGVPWNLKFLWAPLLDLVGTRRRWQVVMQALVGGLMALVALANIWLPGAANPQRWLLAVALVFVVMAVCAATNDIAVDAYYMEGLPDKRDQAAWAGHRVLAYRLAMIFVRTGLVALAALVAQRVGKQDPYTPWLVAFGAGALVMLGVSAFHAWWLPRFETERTSSAVATPGAVWRGFARAFGTYLQQDRVALVLLFIILYRVGDEILFSMTTPFLMRELGVTKGQYAWLAGFVGAAGTVIGTMLGGWWIKARGLGRTIWPITLLMNVNIWVYVWLAWAKPNAATAAGITTIAVIHGYEQIAAGLGSAALLVFLLRTCKPEFKAAHYAIGSAIMSLFATFFGGFGGRMVEWMGWEAYFILAFVATLPGMALLPFVPLHDDPAPTPAPG